MKLNWSWHDFDALPAAALYDILRLRQDVFILEQRSRYADIDGRDPAAWHLCGRTGEGELMAYTRVFPATAPGSASALGRFVVAPAARGKGLARVMMARCLNWLAARTPNAPIHISAQRHLERFYAGYGFTAQGPPYDEAGVLHVDMTRVNRTAALEK